MIQIGVEVQEELVTDSRMFIEWIGDYVIGVAAVFGGSLVVDGARG